MKKLLAILVLGLLLSGNVYAEKIPPKAPSVFNSKIKNKLVKFVDGYKKFMIRQSKEEGTHYHMMTYSKKKDRGYYYSYEDISYRSSINNVIRMCNMQLQTKDCKVLWEDYFNHEESVVKYKAPSINSSSQEKKYVEKIRNKMKKRMIEQAQQGKNYHYVIGSDQKKKTFSTHEVNEDVVEDLIIACNIRIKTNDCRIIFEDYYGQQEAQETVSQQIEQQSAAEDAKIAKQLEPYKRTCRDIGYSEGTDKFGDCVMKLIAMDKKSGESQAMDDANRIERAKILLGLSQMIGQGSSSSSSGSCNLQNWEISGHNKLCYYYCPTGDKVLNIKATANCPNRN